MGPKKAASAGASRLARVLAAVLGGALSSETAVAYGARAAPERVPAGAPGGAEGGVPTGRIDRSPTPAVDAEPRTTVWHAMGATPWSECLAFEQGVVQLLSDPDNSPAGLAGLDPAAERCPGSPAIAVLAVLTALRRDADGTLGLWEPADVATAVERHAALVRAARRGLAQAATEAARRGQLPPRGTWRALAITELSAGDALAGLRALDRARAWGELELGDEALLRAIGSTLAGDLEAALQWVQRAITRLGAGQAGLGAAGRHEAHVALIAAWVFDRAGAAAEARDLLQRLRAGVREPRWEGAVAAALPVHERLYLRALEHAAQSGEEIAATRLLEAYLARPEPRPPDRALAQQQLDELRARADVVGRP